MLKRIYIDNYKCLSNFEFRPEEIQLIIGENGSGKTALFEVLTSVRDFLRGERHSGIFSSTTPTRWATKPLQVVELDVEVNGGHLVTYQLEFAHEETRVENETLLVDGRKVISSTMKHTWCQLVENQDSIDIPFDHKTSAVSRIAFQYDHPQVTEFRTWINSLMLVKVNPAELNYESEREIAEPGPHLKEFASWYRHLDQNLPGLISQVNRALLEIWPQYRGLQLKKLGGRYHILGIDFHSDAEDNFYRLDELSDGQKILIVLYTLMHYAAHHPGSLLWIDEPENFVAMTELQPWLNEIVMQAEQTGFQLLLTSHHPEIINSLAIEHAVILKRKQNQSTTITPFPNDDIGLTPAETVIDQFLCDE